MTLPARILPVLALLGCAVPGCGDSEQPLRVDQVRPTLQALPYRFVLHRVPPPRGTTAAVVGRGFGPKGADIDLAVTFGDGPKPPPALPVPRSGKGNTFGCEGYTLTMNDDSSKPSDSDARYLLRVRMGVEIDKALCEATGATWTGI